MSKLYLGFYEETVSTGGSITLYKAADSVNYNILRINTENPKVYYLVENRKAEGFDKGLLGCYKGVINPEIDPNGAVVWRIDEEALENTWDLNTVNNTVGHYGIMPVSREEYVDLFGDKILFNNPFWKAASGSGNLQERFTSITFSASDADENDCVQILWQVLSVGVDYQSETLSAKENMEYSVDGGAQWKECSADMKAVDFGWDGSAEIQVMFHFNSEGGAETAEIVKEGKTSGSKINATISSSVVSQITKTAGTNDVVITQKVVDGKGKTICTVTVDARKLNAKSKLYIVKYNKKTGAYTLVNAKEYTVSKKGGVSLTVTGSGNYALLGKKDADNVSKEILGTIKVASSSKTVAKGKSAKKAGGATVKAKVTLKNGKNQTVAMKIKVK